MGYPMTSFARGGGLWANHIQGGGVIAAYELVYLDAAGQWQAADADAAATMPVVGLAVEPLRVNQYGRVLLQGFATNNAWTWTPGAALYPTSAPGALSQTPGVVAQVVAFAHSATSIYFDPKGFGHNPIMEGLIDESDLVLWTKDSLLFDVGDVAPPNDRMEDCVVFKAHDDYYYMIVAVDQGAYNFRDFYLVRGDDVRFTNLTVIGNILTNPLDTWEDLTIRPRSIIHDREHSRYILYYEGTGSVTARGIGILVSTYANFPATWVEGANNPLLSGNSVRAPMAFKRWGTYIIFYNRNGAEWFADSSFYDNFYTQIRALSTFGNQGDFRGGLEVLTGWLMMHELEPGGIWHNCLSYLHSDLTRITTHEDYATQFGPTEAYENGACANGFLYREPGSMRIWCYYSCWNAGSLFDRVALAYADLSIKTTFP